MGQGKNSEHAEHQMDQVMDQALGCQNGKAKLSILSGSGLPGAQLMQSVSRFQQGLLWGRQAELKKWDISQISLGILNSVEGPKMMMDP